jgi:DNA replication protein DnaC
MARADGSLRSLLARLSRIDVLVIDDWAMAQLSEPQRHDFWEICEDRYPSHWSDGSSNWSEDSCPCDIDKLRSIDDERRIAW